jgi:hypothetical protein
VPYKLASVRKYHERKGKEMADEITTTRHTVTTDAVVPATSVEKTTITTTETSQPAAPQTVNVNAATTSDDESLRKPNKTIRTSNANKREHSLTQGKPHECQAASHNEWSVCGSG